MPAVIVIANAPQNATRKVALPIHSALYWSRRWYHCLARAAHSRGRGSGLTDGVRRLPSSDGGTSGAD